MAVHCSASTRKLLSPNDVAAVYAPQALPLIRPRKLYEALSQIWHGVATLAGWLYITLARSG